MPVVNFEPNTISRLIDIERRVRNLESQPALNAATVKGDLTVLAPGHFYMRSGTRNVATIGQRTLQDGSGRTEMASMFWRDDGSIALALADLGVALNHPHQQALQWFDRAGDIVMADDTTSGTGIARPYIPCASFWNINTGSIVTTTSTAYQGLQWGYGFRQHPKYLAALLLYSSAANTTGTVQLLDGSNNQIFSMNITGSQYSSAIIGPALWPSTTWNFNEPVQLFQLQGKVTAGTGAIGAAMLGFFGVQS